MALDTVLLDGVRMTLWCEACDSPHVVGVGGPSPWSWNGDMVVPTLTPSVLVLGGSQHVRCHSFVTDGVWHYLDDCNHAKAGQNVPLLPVSEWPFP